MVWIKLRAIPNFSGAPLSTKAYNQTFMSTKRKGRRQFGIDFFPAEGTKILYLHRLGK